MSLLASGYILNNGVNFTIPMIRNGCCLTRQALESGHTSHARSAQMRAGLVPDVKALSGFICSGHSRIMRSKKSDWQDVDKVIEQFIDKGVAEGRKPELTGGGSIRSA